MSIHANTNDTGLFSYSSSFNVIVLSKTFAGNLQYIDDTPSSLLVNYLYYQNVVKQNIS